MEFLAGAVRAVRDSVNLWFARATISAMKHRGLKLILALLLGWHVVGPLVDAVDFWDDLQAEMRDIARSAGGLVTLVLAGVSVAMALHRQLKMRNSSFLRSLRGCIAAPAFRPFRSSIPTVKSFAHSPPSPLRI